MLILKQDSMAQKHLYKFQPTLEIFKAHRTRWENSPESKINPPYLLLPYEPPLTLKTKVLVLDRLEKKNTTKFKYIK